MFKKGDILVRTECGYRYKILYMDACNVVVSHGDNFMGEPFTLDIERVVECLRDDVLHLEDIFTKKDIVKHTFI